ncbi:hypothetical protein DPV78_004460 [Talaromyces pinophilus]|nr:hypothetical protein DPV78_004460 [Talaromyces pinophilus]
MGPYYQGDRPEYAMSIITHGRGDQKEAATGTRMGECVQRIRKLTSRNYGWVSHDEYEEAMRLFKKHQGSLESLRDRLEQVS